MKSGEIMDKAVDRILEPYSLATESEYERVGTIVRKALLEQDRESRADERRRLVSGRMLKVAMKKAAELGIFTKDVGDEQYLKDKAAMETVIEAIVEAG